MNGKTLLLLLAMAGTGGLLLAAEDAAPAKVAHDVHDGYFVSNKFEPDEPVSFVVIRDQKTFDSVFGAAFVMGDKAHRLPPKAFETRMVIAAIKRGKAMWSFKVESVTQKAGTLTLKYSANSTPSESATFAVPLIVSIPKGDYATFEFVENGKGVKTIQ